MGFSNATMRQRIRSKPHIQKIDGKYRVSQYKKSYPRGLEWRWVFAHNFARRLNAEMKS